MKVNVIGIREVHYTSKAGRAVDGFELYCTKEDSNPDSGLNGLLAVKFFTRADCSKVLPGKLYDLGLDVSGGDRAVVTSVQPL